jgi:putative component of membrane protein insertase Oxa1/YidC/SpoIIIJ protein YidD
MQVSHQGLISRILSQLIYLSNFFEERGFQTVFIKIATYAIRDYKSYISPYKGFSCAYKKLYGSESCSEHFLDLVESYGLSQAVPLFQQRLEDCQQANSILLMSVLEEGSGEDAEIEIDMEDMQEEQLDETHQNDKTSESSASADWCGRYFNDCNCGDSEIPLWGPCDSNHNGVLDQGDCGGAGIPCDGIDIGGCDCNF